MVGNIKIGVLTCFGFAQFLSSLRAVLIFFKVKPISEAVETYASEIGFTLKNIKTARKELKNWAKPKQVNTPIFMFPTKSYIMKEPYGTVLIIGPFNYPFQLLIEPLIGAIAAGNTVILKPSEYTPTVSTVIQSIIEEVFDAEYVSIYLRIQHRRLLQ